MTTGIGYALLAAAANVVGGLLVTASPRTRSAQRLLLAFGAGFMVAVAVEGLLPHAVERGPGAGLGVLIGFFAVHLTQHVLTPHFHFGEETHHEAMVGRWVGTVALAGLLLHAFFDGVAIASGFGVDASLGLLVFVAMLLHKVPEGVTIASIMLASGNSRRRALAAVATLGAVTVLGVVLVGTIEPLEKHGLALSAGVTLYVAASNLIPELQKERGTASAAATFAGVGLFLVTRHLLGLPTL